MTTKIGIVSDIHSAVTPLKQAFEIFDKENVSLIICAGDIAGYGEDELSEVIALLQSRQCLLVTGNHDEFTAESFPVKTTDEYYSDEISQFFSQLPVAISLEIEAKKLFIVHAQPPDQQHGGIKLLDQQGDVLAEQVSDWEQKLAEFDFDVLIVGHTHQVFSQQLNQTLVLNPGSTLFNHSCMVLSLPQMQTKCFALGGHEIIPSWNWGQFFQKPFQ